MDDHQAPLDEDTLAALAGRIESLSAEHVDWVVQLFLECRRARDAEANFLAAGCQEQTPADTAQIALDTADWLRTLWEVGYMGSEALPAPPRTDFPQINVEDIVKSALFARIRRGKRPLPFPPPTRHGMPWHEIVESDEVFDVRVEATRDNRAIVEGCAEWQIIAGAANNLVVQHRGKGPLYRLTLDRHGDGKLQRQPATLTRRIVRQERAGIVAWLLEWPREEGGVTQVPLRAANRERAENEAQRWVALRHPDLYGQIRYEHCEA